MLQRQAERQKAERAARAAQLQRRRAQRRVETLLAEDEDILLQQDDDEQPTMAGSMPAAGRPTARVSGAAAVTHEERRLRFEQGMRQQTEVALEYVKLLAPQHAAYDREDLDQQLARVQQRVHTASSHLQHVGCAAGCGSVVLRWRPVILHTLFGAGAISIPTCRCAIDSCNSNHLSAPCMPVRLGRPSFLTTH